MWHTTSMRETVTVRLGPRGRLVLPSRVRKRLGLEPGDQLVLTVDEIDQTIGLEHARALARRYQGALANGMLGVQVTDRSLADELLAERREEAERERGSVPPTRR